MDKYLLQAKNTDLNSLNNLNNDVSQAGGQLLSQSYRHLQLIIDNFMFDLVIKKVNGTNNWRITSGRIKLININININNGYFRKNNIEIFKGKIQNIKIEFEIDSNNMHNELRNFFMKLPLEFRILFSRIITRRKNYNSKISIATNINNGIVDGYVNDVNGYVNDVNIKHTMNGKWESTIELAQDGTYVIYIDDNPEVTFDDDLYKQPNITVIKLQKDNIGGLSNYLNPELKFNINGTNLEDVIKSILKNLPPNITRVVFKFDFDCTLAYSHLFKSILNTGPFKDAFLKYLNLKSIDKSTIENEKPSIWINPKTIKYFMTRSEHYKPLMKFLQRFRYEQLYTNYTSSQQSNRRDSINSNSGDFEDAESVFGPPKPSTPTTGEREEAARAAARSEAVRRAGQSQTSRQPTTGEREEAARAAARSEAERRAGQSQTNGPPTAEERALLEARAKARAEARAATRAAVIRGGVSNYNNYESEI